ncbi:MAG: hypothetical protein ACI9CE_003656 [Flavobacterium sp.]|jgi:hypothetical protein
MKTNTLNLVSASCSLAIILGWSAYWVVQVIDVFELLALANAGL